MKVFISWSGPVSFHIACALRDWLPCVLPSVKPFVSSEDIAKGSRWGQSLAQELNDTNFGIICVTTDNTNAPWLIFEAGALSKAIDSSRVVPFLFRVQANELPGALGQFQSIIYGENPVLREKEFFDLVSGMNEAMGEGGKIDKDLLHRIFKKWWPDLDASLAESSSYEDFKNWLYKPGDLARLELKRDVKWIWVVTPSPAQDLQRTCIREMIKKNIARDVIYTFIMRKSPENDAVVTTLESLFAGHEFHWREIERETFDSLAVTHYILLNPGHLDQYSPEVLLELPIDDGDHWIKVSAAASMQFTERFQKMLDDEDIVFPPTVMRLSTQETGSTAAS